jgi:hypothetical protein
MSGLIPMAKALKLSRAALHKYGLSSGGDAT